MRSSTMGNRGLGDAHCGRSRGGLVLRRLAIWVIFYWEFRVACPRGIHLPPYSRPPPRLGALLGGQCTSLPRSRRDGRVRIRAYFLCSICRLRF